MECTRFLHRLHFVATTAIILGNKGKYCWLSNTPHVFGGITVLAMLLPAFLASAP